MKLLLSPWLQNIHFSPLLCHSCPFLQIPVHSCGFLCHSCGFLCHSCGFLCHSCGFLSIPAGISGAWRSTEEGVTTRNFRQAACELACFSVNFFYEPKAVINDMKHKKIDIKFNWRHNFAFSQPLWGFHCQLLWPVTSPDFVDFGPLVTLDQRIDWISTVVYVRLFVVFCSLLVNFVVFCDVYSLSIDFEVYSDVSMDFCSLL